MIKGCRMENNRQLAMITSYYLSRFNINARNNLGYSTWNDTYNDIGRKLDISPSSIKNMRDEFDAIHSNTRKGWYQRPLRPSRRIVVEIFADFGEDALTTIVKDILKLQNIEDYISVVRRRQAKDHKSDKDTKSYGKRGQTGVLAEKFFEEMFDSGRIEHFSGRIEHFSGRIEHFSGKLSDTRAMGCGYDYEWSGHDIVFEVKGLATEQGGVTFTDKEWDTAKMMGERYFLVLVTNMDNFPVIRMLKNPYKNLDAKRRIQTVLSVTWNADVANIIS